MAFDSDQYFSKRQRLAESTNLKQIADAADAKMLRLEEGNARANLEVIHAREVAAETMTGRLGLDTDSLAGRAVNVAANVLSGISRGSGDVAALPATLATIANESGMSESDFQAYNRYVTGRATPQDMALLNSATQVSDVPGIKNATRLEMFKQATEARKSAIAIDKKSDLSAAVDQGSKNALQQDLGGDFDAAWNTTKEGWNKLLNGDIQKGVDSVLTGTGKLANKAVEAAFTHPQGTLEYVAENVPQMAIGLAGKAGAGVMAASNAGYGADYYHKGIAKYQAEHGGQYPPEAMRKQMAKAAGLAAGMEQISDKVSLGLGKVATAAKIGANSGRVAKTLGATAGGSLNESITEGIQTYLEGEASLTPASARDIYVGAAIGGITGGAISGGLRGINELGEASLERAASKVPVTDTPKFKEAFKAAVEANNADVFLDKDTSDYNPVAAIGVLLQAAKTETATPEIKSANFTKATEVVESLEQEREALISGNPESIAVANAEIAKIDLMMSKVDPADTKTISDLESMKQEYVKEIEKDSGTSAPKIEQLDKALAVARRVQNELGTLANPVTPDDFQNLVASVKSTEKGVASEAADKLINLSMTNPNAVDVKALTDIVLDKANGLKPEQRARLRQFTEARRKENALMNMGKVSAMILTGDPAKRQMGIKDYREQIAVALTTGNQKAAERPLALMSNFVASHSEKARLTAEALQTGEVRQVVRLENKNWEIRDPSLPPLTQKEMTDSGSVTVNPDLPASVKLVENINREAKILADSYAQLSSTVKAKFSGQKVQAPVLSIYPLGNGKEEVRPEETSGEKASQPPTPSTQVTKPTQAKPVTPTPSTSWAIDNARNMVAAIKKSNPKLLDQVTELHAQDKTAKEIATALKIDTDMVRDLHVGLGLPNQGKESGSAAMIVPGDVQEREAFLKWVNDRKSTSKPTGSSVAVAPSASASPTAKVSGKPAYVGTQADVVSLNTRLKKNGAKPTAKLLSVAETVKVNKIINSLKGKMKDAAAKLRFVAQDGDHRGTMYQEEGLIGINLNSKFVPRKWADESTDIDKTSWLVVHELAHAVDAENDYQSSSDWLANESLLNEAKSVKANSTKWVVAYPMRELNAATDAEGKFLAAREFIAQLMAYEHANSQEFAEQMPLNAAWLQQQSLLGFTPTSTQLSPEAQAAQDAVGLTTLDIAQLTEQEIEDVITQAKAEEAGTGTTPTDATQVPNRISIESLGKQTTGEQQDVAQAESPVAEPVVYKGLKVFAQKVKELPGKMQDVYLKTNLVAQFLKQKLNSDKYKSARPLVGMEDFLTAWNNNKLPMEDFLMNFMEANEELSDEQKTALNHMRGFLTELLPKFDADLTEYTGDPAFKSRDPMQYLIENGTVEENIKAAMAYSVYSFLLTQANNPASLTREQVNEMHSKDAEADLTDEAYGDLSQYNSFEQTFIDSVGSVAVQALGLVPEEDAPINLLPNLVTAMGIRILAVMEREGHITREARNAREVELLMDPTSDVNSMFGPETTFNYIKFTREEDGALTAPVKMIREMDAGTGGITDRIFGSEKAARQAGTKPVKFTQQFAKNTEQEISEAQHKVIQDTMNTPHTAIQAMMELYYLIGRENFLIAGGWIKLPEDGSAPNNVHEVNLKSVKAQNQNLENQLDKMVEMYESNAPEQEYFVEQFVGKNYRAYFGNQSLNQQTSKFHRFMFQRPGWEVEIDLMDSAMVDEYKVAIAMSLGVKTDAQLNSKTLATLDAWLEKNSKIADAIEAIRAGLVEGTDVLDNPQTKALIGEAAASAEGMMTMQAMVSYAHYLQALKRAEDTGQTKFKTTLLVGVDGKTNGPMLSILALGAAPDLEGFFTLLNRGGFYSDADGQPSHYSQFASQGGRDLYQDFGMTFLSKLYQSVIPANELQAKLATAMKTKKGTSESKSAWKDYFTFTGQHEVDALQSITGNLITDDGLNVTSAGRNLPKTPMTSFFFGSAVKKSIANMENKFIASVYENIEGISAGSKKAPTREEFINSMNILIARGRGTAIPATTTVDQMMKKDFLKNREAALRQSFQHIMAKPVKTSMESYFAVFIDRRKSLVNSVQAGFSAYAAAYNALRNTEINRLINSGEIASRESEGELKPLHEMSVKQERELRLKVKSLLPVMHNDFSILENNIDAGIYMAKSERNPTTDIMNKAKVTLGAPLKGSDQKNIEAQSLVRKESGPGVAGASYPIHSGDAAIMHKSMGEIDVAEDGNEDINTTVNVHDEASNSVAKVGAVARTMNKNTVETFLNFSPTREAAFMLERILTNMVSGIKDGSIHKSAVRDMFESWLESYNKGRFDEPLTVDEIAQYVINDTYSNAFAADSMRLEGISHLTSTDQYTWEGGQFNDAEAMAAIRKQAADKLANLKPDAPKSVMKMVEFLNKTYVEEELGVAEYDGSTISLDPDKEFDQETRAISAVLLGLPGTLAMRAIEEIKQQYPEVKEKMTGNFDFFTALDSVIKQVRAEVMQTLTQMAARLPKNTSQWGDLGESSGHNANLLALFDGKESISLKELAPVLFQELKTAGSMSDSYHMLLKQAMRVVDNDLKIVLVRPDTKSEAILDKGASNARGWYVSRNNDQAIYVLSPDFANAKVAPELLVHELVHGALARLIEAELQAPTNTAVGQHVKNLQALLEEAKTFVKDNDIKGVEAALVNVHELVSWGLTNKNFQKNVLGKMTSAVETKGTGLVSKMAYFIKNLTGILFRGTKLNAEEKATNGLMVLAVNSAALYAAAANNKKRSDVVTNQEADPVTEVEALTTTELYNNLYSHNGEEVDPTHNDHLLGLLNGIVKQLHGPMGTFKEELMKRADLSGRDILAEAITSGQMPFGSTALNIGGMTEQEAFVLEQVEATVATALTDGGAQTGIVHRELLGLYEEMRAKLKPEHFHVEGATAIEIQEAKEIHDFMFKIEAKDGKSDYLSRFAAIGLVHKEVREAMKIATKMRSEVPADTDFLSRLMVWFEKVLGMVSAKLTNTYPGMNADQKLGSLVQQLVDSEAKRKRTVIQRKMKVNAADTMMGNASEAIRDKVVKFGESKFFKESTNTVVRTVGAMGAVIAGDRMQMFGKILNDIRNENVEGKQGLMAGILSEIRGAVDGSVAFHFLLRATKRIEGIRKDLMTGTSKLVLESFVNKGKNLQQSDKKAISAGVLRTDMGNLLANEHFSMEELNVLVQNEKALERAINSFEARLTTKYRHFYIKQSRLLGYELATGDARDVVYKNAGNIARMYETPYEGRLTDAEIAEAEKIIDALATLHAMKHTRTSHKIRLRKLFKDEMARTDGGNGLELTMKMHQKLLQESKEKLFDSQEALFMKGYTSEIYNPYKSVKAATAEEGKELEAQGWIKGDPVVNDTDFANQPKRWLYTLRDGGQSRRVSGTISNTGMNSRGTKMHDGNLNDNSFIGKAHQQQMEGVSAQKRKALANMFKADPDFNPAEHNKGKQFMTPVFNPEGKIVNWRYMMKQSTKDRVLDRDNRFENILGTMAGSIYDKQSSKVQNRAVITALKAQYDAEYGMKPGSYVAIGPMSTDPEFREIYNLFPQDTKNAIREMFGKDEMMVRVDLLDINFGYRKLSWADGFNMDKEELEKHLVNKMMVTATEYVFGKKAPLRVRQGQLWWQTVVQMTKDNMVVKSFSTLAGNFKSNVTELLWFGVNPLDIIKHHRVAFKGALDYRRDSTELFDLQEKLALDYMVGPARKEMEARVIRLQDAINRNPIKEMIDAGLMPTIVEDIDMQEDIHSYKSKFVRATEKVTKHLNPNMVTAGKWVLMTQDTPLYKWMSHGTQLSDFVARYTLYQHLTNRSKDPMEKNAAIQMTSEAFVNYDIPSHRRLQALNDDGFVWFTKYYLRIQKVIMMLMRENPGRAMGMIGLETYFATMPTLLDSAAASKFGNNPFSTGALKFVGTQDDTMVIKALMSPFK